MDDLTAVRELADDVTGLSDEARAAARVRLRRAIAQEGRPRPLSRRLMLRAVAGTAAAAVAGGVVLATRHEPGTDTPQLAGLSAAQLLRKAADRSRADGAGTPIPRDDQYVYTRTYITRTYVKDGGTRTWADESWLSVDGSRPSRREEHGTVHDDPPLGEHEVRVPPTRYTELAKWPTDPDKLLTWLRRGTEEGYRGAFMNACQFFVVPRVMPPGLEAATFEAVARIPGIRIDRQAVDALGRRGIAVSYPEFDFAFVFDAHTSAYLGMRLTGSTVTYHGRKAVHHGWYHEVSALRELGVVDRIGQRP
ncbi:CU044_5270 family protein [Streptomyces spinosirectus]